MIVVNRLGGAAGVGSLGYGSSESSIVWAKEQLSYLGYWGTTFTGQENANFNAALSAFQRQWNAESRSYTVNEDVSGRCTNIRRGGTITSLASDGDYGCRSGYALAAATANDWAHAPSDFVVLDDGGEQTGVPDCRRRGVSCRPGGDLPDTDVPLDAPPAIGGSWWSKWWWTLPAAAAAAGGGYLVVRSRRSRPAVAMAGFRRRRRR